MKPKSNYEIVAVKYLLGELSGAEQRRFEERYFADDHIFEEFLIVEDELIDDYVQEKLSPSERERFERQFLISPMRKKRVKFALGLINFAARTRGDLPRKHHRGPSGSWRQLLLDWLRFKPKRGENL